jgi:hypothetical protein
MPEIPALMGHNGGPSGDWIKAYRSLRFHPTVGFLNTDGLRRKNAKPTCEAMAWLDLCMQAEWKGRQYRNMGKDITLERGQLVGSRAWLASRWGWTEDAVKWFLKKLERDEMITLGDGKQTEKSRLSIAQSAPNQSSDSAQSKTQSKTPRRAHFANVLTVCNYNIYQTAEELEILLKSHRKTDQTPNQNVNRAGIAPGSRPYIEEGKKERIGEREELTLLMSDSPREPGRPRPPEPVKSEVHVNCAAVVAEGLFQIPFATIDPAARIAHLPEDEARNLVAGHFKAQFANGIIPRDPIAVALAAIREAKRPKPRAKAPAGGYTPEFEWFWERYPNDTGKAEAFAAWRDLTKTEHHDAAVGLKKQHANLLEQSKRYVNGKCCCPHASTWLRKRRWEDGAVQPPPPDVASTAKSTYSDFARDRTLATQNAMLKPMHFDN